MPGKFASSIVASEKLETALAPAIEQALNELGGPPDLAFAFFSHGFAESLQAGVALIQQRAQPKHLLGCTGESIVGKGTELEGEPCVSLWFATLEGATLTPMRLDFKNDPQTPTITGWPDDLAVAEETSGTLLLLADPFSFPADFLLQTLREARPNIVTVGGMASGGHSPGSCRVVTGNGIWSTGAVGILVQGSLPIRTVVSQGCRPIGQPYVITKAQRNVILELGGKPALERLSEVLSAASEHDRELLRHGLHVGRVVNEYQEGFKQGDFLVRNYLGHDQNSGAIAIGDFVRVGQTVQFHVRDAQSADEELIALLDQARAEFPAPAGALLFTCNGRGSRLFESPHHDASAVATALGPIPLAGFFAQGEIGPVAGKTYLHGFTASVAIFGGKE